MTNKALNLAVSAEFQRLDEILAADKSTGQNIKQCEAEVALLESRLREIVKTNPQAVAEFLQITAIRNADGSIKLNSQGEVYGRYQRKLWQLEDPNFKSSISEYSSKLMRGCLR